MKLKEYLREHKIRYQTVAESLGITEQSVKNIVAGTQRPGLLLALKIQKFTGGRVTPEQLAEDFDEISQVKEKKIR
ncbi:MAG: helix-turn-helix domain-containing protein [Parachlamydiaceae bacterium]|nr:helix-turn-helix domain-containing protein [Parachlamydiaceae bacterium]